MPDVQEVFHMATQKIRPDDGALERQAQHQRRTVRRRKTAAIALVAALIAGGISAYLITERTDRPQPLEAPDPVARGFAIVSLDGEILANVPNLPEGARDIDVAPDGRSIVFASEHEGDGWQIYTMGLDGSNPTRLTDVREASSPAWSPDGEWIAFDAFVDDGDRGLFTMPAMGGEVTRLTTLSTPLDESAYPAWSPDGERIAYQIFFGSDPGIRLIASNLRFPCPGSNPGSRPCRPIRVTDGHDFGPSWSPDGRRLLFSRTEIDGQLMSIRVPEFGSRPSANVRLEWDSTANDAWPSWSPDGTLIAFVSDTGERRSVNVLDPSAGTDVVVAEDAGDADWMPDGRSLLVQYLEEA